ncbi:BspA family leucine-rich repeat surface protein [Mycoplasma mycoides]|uniref:BspA family leucine-rich repeat surface protein n=1 Tax=Mycoplasma mycoides TaxID=2102 RepID=UPI00273553CD|nr:BspA family leucine-rich repeat surface protein [Mycoplasma mycoides]MDP4040359.1 BspA family leucine-rich repeat surface protein [Mycoplasma mycoides]MDP4041271.1 BspA family leucine-rich repeat surface protein [Mycoplasma mycoides]MDP4042177.1 BspA family leucine-rich repeat surface protein [Mycoplasma mycoides]MDP4043625.1 BspA family leucine-rich repeat surface protein [Mycoplasma mycoides]MDP4044492.1 BspA family leucine-rich repeat surface protein [Mycoplasma mycoides]
MKKVLTLLTSFSLIATSSVLVVSCKNDGIKGKVEKHKDISRNSSKKEEDERKDSDTMKEKSQDDQPHNNSSSSSGSSSVTNGNILSSIEDENLFIYGYNKWLEDSKNGKSEHFINPKNPNEILLLGYTKETRGRKDSYKLNSIPSNINKVPKSLPTKITSLEAAFKDNVNEIIDGIESWDTSRITNMNRTFYDAKKFNGDISKWNTNNVEDMTYMFFNAESFKGDLSKWKVPKSFYSSTFDKYSGIQDKTNLFPQFKK